MKLTYFGVENIPMVEPGDDLVELIDRLIARWEGHHFQVVVEAHLLQCPESPE